MSVALGDVNSDGKLDVITTNRGNSTDDKGTVNVLLGTGGGTFAAPVSFEAGFDPVSVALGDLNADDKLDLVVANQGSDGFGSVGVLLGRGDGTFAATEDAAAADRPISVALADLDGDSKLDLVMASRAVRVLLGRGDGTFTPKADYPAWADLTSLAVGDMNGDGTLDIVVASEGTTELLLGTGDGTFAPRLRYAARSWKLALGDLNGDGRLDVATTAYASSVDVLPASSVDVLLRSCQ
jgi:hypothetical protein